jgi:hypothetical protein
MTKPMLLIGGNLLLTTCRIQVWQFAFKFTLVDGDLYRRTVVDLLLKCLDSDRAKVTMCEVHEGICGTHKLSPKMKWLL